MPNPLQDNYFRCAFLMILFLLILLGLMYDRQTVECMTSRLGLPGILMGTEPDTDEQWENLPSGKPAMLNAVDNDPAQYNFRDVKESFKNDSEEVAQFDGDDLSEIKMALQNRRQNKQLRNRMRNFDDDQYDDRTEYNTGRYPQPLDDRPDLGSCQNKPTRCAPCPVKCEKTVVVHKLSPELLDRLKAQLEIV